MASLPPIPASKYPAFNPQTRRSHRLQVFWQILLPLFLGVMVCGVLFYLLLAGGPSSMERGAQVAVILLAVPTLLLGLAWLALLLVLVSGVGKALGWLPPQAARAQRAVQLVSGGAQKVASALAAPFIQVEAWGAALRRVFRRNR